MTVLGRIFHTGCERTTTPRRAAQGLGMGALTGAGLTIGYLLVTGLISGGPTSTGVIVAIFAIPAALVIWGAGLFILAAPGWWLLHVLGARCQQAAMIYGGLLTYGVCLAYVWLDGSRPFEVEVLWSLPMLGLAAMGVAVGWIVAKVAYQPAKAS